MANLGIMAPPRRRGGVTPSAQLRSDTKAVVADEELPMPVLLTLLTVTLLLMFNISKRVTVSNARRS